MSTVVIKNPGPHILLVTLPQASERQLGVNEEVSHNLVPGHVISIGAREWMPAQEAVKADDAPATNEESKAGMTHSKEPSVADKRTQEKIGQGEKSTAEVVAPSTQKAKGPPLAETRGNGYPADKSDKDV